jgi:hypothetical protein
MLRYQNPRVELKRNFRDSREGFGTEIGSSGKILSRCSSNFSPLWKTSGWQNKGHWFDSHAVFHGWIIIETEHFLQGIFPLYTGFCGIKRLVVSLP